MPTFLPGEDLSTAIAITPGADPQLLNDTLSTNTGNVFYTFTLTSRSSFWVSDSSDPRVPSFNHPDIAILDQSGNPVKVYGKSLISNNAGSLPNLISSILEPGTYFLRLFAADLPTSPAIFVPPLFYNLTYQSTSEVSNNPLSPYDIAGNTPDQALNLGAVTSFSIPPGSPSRGSYTTILNANNPVDYYQFEIGFGTELASLNLTVTGLQSNADLQLIQDNNRSGTLEPEELETAVISAHAGTQDEAIYRNLSAGQYFVRVNRVDGDTAYTLNLSTGNPGELLAAEFEIGNLGSVARSFAASFDNDNTADLYRFNLLSDAELNLELTGQNGSSHLRLYRELTNGTQNFLQRIDSNALSTNLTRTLAPGVYYLRVTGTLDSDYSLSLTANPVLPTERISVAADGQQAYGEASFFAPGSFFPSISGDGRYVVFTSLASNLVAGDTNSSPDVFVRDRLTGETSRISIATDGTQGNWGATIGNNTPISADGQYVVFTSGSSNLVSNDTNENISAANMFQDAFVHDRTTGQTIRVNVATDGTQADRGGGTFYPAISANGRYITFTSVASNLVADDTNEALTQLRGRELAGADIFVHDLLTGITTRESVTSEGMQANDISLSSQISADGRYLVFLSWASDLVADDTNNQLDIFLRDRLTGTVTQITPNGLPWSNYNLSMSDDGRYISYIAEEKVWVYDRLSQQTTQVDVGFNGVSGNGASYTSRLSADGRYVVFSSEASNLVENDINGQIDVFVRNLLLAQTTLVSLADDQAQGNGNSAGQYLRYNPFFKDTPSISADGRYIAFTSDASNLVEGDTNQAYDIFVRDLGS